VEGDQKKEDSLANQDMDNPAMKARETQADVKASEFAVF